MSLIDEVLKDPTNFSDTTEDLRATWTHSFGLNRKQLKSLQIKLEDLKEKDTHLKVALDTVTLNMLW